MRSPLPAPLTLLAALALSGCWKDVAVTWPAGSGDSGPGGDISGDLVLVDANNYGYRAGLAADTVITAEGVDLTFDWSALTQDLTCADLDPVDDIDTLELWALPDLTQEEAETKLLTDGFQQVDVEGWGSGEVGTSTSVAWSSLLQVGLGEDRAADYVAGAATWMLVLLGPDDRMTHVRTVAFLEPNPRSSETTVMVEDACGALTHAATLDTLTPVEVPSAGPWTVDWSALTTNGRGAALDLTSIDHLTLARFDAEPAELAAQITALDDAAADAWTWTTEREQHTLDLSTPSDDGTVPAALTGSGTWLLTLECSVCFDPAPVFLTIVSPQ